MGQRRGSETFHAKGDRTHLYSVSEEQESALHHQKNDKVLGASPFPHCWEQPFTCFQVTATELGVTLPAPHSRVPRQLTAATELCHQPTGHTSEPFSVCLPGWSRHTNSNVPATVATLELQHSVFVWGGWVKSSIQSSTYSLFSKPLLLSLLELEQH